MRSRTSQRTRTSISNDISNGPVCDHGLSNGNGDEPMDAVKMEHKSEIKVNGTPRSLKQQKKDMMNMILKDRLKALNDSAHNEADLSIDKSDSISNDAESTTQLTENASTSKDGTVQQNASEAGDHSARRGESLAVLLSQGLTSGDAEKIDSVLSRSDPQTISATLNELPVTQILPLLKQIEFRFRNRKTLDVRCWARWMQCTISMHAPYLSTIGSLESELGTLYNWMRNRSANISSLYNLHGKFTLLLEQIERRANPKFFIFNQPTVLFNEGTEDASDHSGETSEEDDFGGENESVSSNEDWWEDDGVASEGDGGQDSQSESEESSSDEGSSGEESDGSKEQEEGKGQGSEGKRGSEDEMDVD